MELELFIKRPTALASMINMIMEPRALREYWVGGMSWLSLRRVSRMRRAGDKMARETPRAMDFAWLRLALR